MQDCGLVMLYKSGACRSTFHFPKIYLQRAIDIWKFSVLLSSDNVMRQQMWTWDLLGTWPVVLTCSRFALSRVFPVVTFWSRKTGQKNWNCLVAIEWQPAEPREQRITKPFQFVRMGTRHNESERLNVRTAPGGVQAPEPNLVDTWNSQPRVMWQCPHGSEKALNRLTKNQWVREKLFRIRVGKFRGFLHQNSQTKPQKPEEPSVAKERNQCEAKTCFAGSCER